MTFQAKDHLDRLKQAYGIFFAGSSTSNNNNNPIFDDDENSDYLEFDDQQALGKGDDRPWKEIFSLSSYFTGDEQRAVTVAAPRVQATPSTASVAAEPTLQEFTMYFSGCQKRTSGSLKSVRSMQSSHPEVLCKSKGNPRESFLRAWPRSTSTQTANLFRGEKGKNARIRIRSAISSTSTLTLWPRRRGG